MNKNKSVFIVLILSVIFIIFMITSSSSVISSVSFSISIWKDNLFPTLFPFFVISSILMQYGVVDIIGKILSYPMKKIYNLPSSSGFVLAASLFSGFPSGAKYTSELVINSKLDLDSANRLLTFTHYSNPLFILGFISLVLNRKIAIIILISHVFGGLVVGKIFNNKKQLLFEFKENNTLSDISFGNCLQKSIMDSLNTMFLLLGIVTIFSILTALIQKIFVLSSFYSSILSGILEMSQGVKNISLLRISEFLKTILITGIISFGGLSVHMQVISIITDANLKYKPFLLARIVHALLSSGFVSILYIIFIN